MATGTTNRNLCDACGKAKGISKCEGCGKIFCFNHFGNHRQELNEQLDEVEVTRDLFRQSLTEQTTDPQKHTLIQHINDWERDAIKKIRKAANEAREMLLDRTTKHISEIEIKLNKLTDQLRQSRQENDFVETDLRQWKEELTQLTNELSNPSTITLQQDSKALVTKIYINTTSIPSSMPKIGVNARWKQNGITIAGGNQKGDRLTQLCTPWGLYVDNEVQTIYVADSANHRIVEWKNGATTGQVVAGGNGQGNQSNQLNSPSDVIVDKETNSLIICDYNNERVVRWPRRNGARGETIISNVNCARLAMDNDGYLYVSDYKKHEVRRWRIGDGIGTVVAGGNGAGNRLDQLDEPLHIFVDQDHSVYISDARNHRVMKWEKGAKQGMIVAGGQGPGNELTQLYHPSGVIVDELGTVYVADTKNYRIMRWCRGAKQGSIVIGRHGEGKQSNQFDYPMDLSFDRQGNLYVVDSENQRVQRFDIN